MTASTDLSNGPGMWRFASMLPIDDLSSVVSIGEGDTPLLPALGPTLGALPVGSISVKAEYQNPTGSFKDRIASVAAALIRQRGLVGAVGTSSGNGGAAMAAFGARAGFPVVLFTVSGIVDGKLRQIQSHGAATHVVERLGHGGAATEGVAPTIARLAEEHGWLAFLTGARYAPEAMRGAETVAFELAEQHPGADVVYVPVGGGGLLGSIWRGYQRLGGRVPRLVGVQPAGCSTLHRAVDGDRSELARVETTISGLQVSVLFDWGAIDAVTESGGHVVEVSDESVWEAQKVLAREEGVFVEPAGATALAGLVADVRSGRVASGDDVVLVASGAGYKDPVSLERLGADNPPVRISPDEVAGAFGRMRGSR
jgi:threonine synthase